MAEWTLTRLGAVVKTNVSSYSAKDNWEYVNYLDTGSITENVIDHIQHINVGYEKLPSRAKRKVSYNSIVYSAVRPNQRHFGIMKNIPENFLVSTGFIVIDVDMQLIDADFLWLFVKNSG